MTITRITVMTAMFTLFVSSVATAQSGSRSGSYSSRNVPGTRSTHGTTSGGSTSRRAPSAATSRLVRPPTATLNGYCPVSLAEDTKWVLGKAAFAVTVDGHTYWLASTAHRERFQAEPAKYVPAMHGDCVVCYADSGVRVRGALDVGMRYQGRYYFFPDEKRRAQFRNDPERYVDADLALEGKCAVCRVTIRQDVPGLPELTALHKGLRYYFPAKAQLDAFLANPGIYAEASKQTPTSRPVRSVGE